MLRRLGVYVGASWDYLLRLCWGLLAYVGPSWDYVGRSWVVCWAILALSWGHLGTMLGFVGSSWAYVGPAWDYVGRSWVLCWAILALCWPILGHVARCSNLTPCNSPQRAVFTVIHSVFCTFPTPILTPKSLQITLPPHPPPWLPPINVSAFPTLSVITIQHHTSYLYSLHISTLCTPLISSHLYSLHISLSSHLYSLHIPTVCTSLLSDVLL